MSPQIHRLAAVRAARLIEFEVGSRPSTTAIELVGGELIGPSTTELRRLS
jgi:hypothetical protein